MGERIRRDFRGVNIGFEPLPAGSYNARIIDVKKGISQNGNEKLEVTFKVTDPATYRGRQAWANISLVDHALFSLKQLLHAAGYPREQLEGVVEFDTDDLRGVEVTIHLRNSRYERADGLQATEIFRYSPLMNPDELEKGTAATSSKSTSWDEL